MSSWCSFQGGSLPSIEVVHQDCAGRGDGDELGRTWLGRSADDHVDRVQARRSVGEGVGDRLVLGLACGVDDPDLQLVVAWGGLPAPEPLSPVLDAGVRTQGDVGPGSAVDAYLHLSDAHTVGPRRATHFD